MTNSRPLDEVADSLGRSRHDLMIHKKIDEIMQEGVEDNTLYFFEKNHYYNGCNITPSEAHLVGDQRGDVDLLMYNAEKDSMKIREVKSNQLVPEEMSVEDRKERFHVVDDGHDQINDYEKMVDIINSSYGVDISIEDAEVVVWSDVFDSEPCDVEVPGYRGEHFCTSNAYELAQQSEAFEALNKSAYQNELLLKGRRVRKI